MAGIPRDLSPRIARAADVDAGTLARAKGGQRVTVCIPARDEAETVGAIVDAIRRDLIEAVALVDDLVVMDDHSTDATAAIAAAAGATVIDGASVIPGIGGDHGKGQTLWRSLAATEGDIVVWCDADIRDFDTRFISGLLAPLVTDPSVAFTKGFYDRPDADGAGGGRVTELVARPALSLWFPALTGVIQPLSGEFAGRRTLLERLPFASGYGVDLGLLVDVARTAGVDAIVQVDLGRRLHRNRSLEQLGAQAMAVWQVAMARAGLDPVSAQTVLRRPGLTDALVVHSDLPPIAEIDGDDTLRSA